MNNESEPEAFQDEVTASGRGQEGIDVGAAFSYLPSDPLEYAELEKKLKRKIDWTLMPVLVAMIVLKYAYKVKPWFFSAAMSTDSEDAAISIAMPYPTLDSRELRRI